MSAPERKTAVLGEGGPQWGLQVQGPLGHPRACGDLSVWSYSGPLCSFSSGQWLVSAG